MVAALLAAAILLAADRVFEQLGMSRDTMAHSVAGYDRDVNARQALRAWIAQADVSPPPAGVTANTFGGTERAATFVSWCDVSGAWLTQCTVSLRVLQDSGHTVVVATSSAGDSVRIRPSYRDAGLRYLLDARHGGHWLDSWGQGPTVPLAIGLVSGPDTMVWRIGDRG